MAKLLQEILSQPARIIAFPIPDHIKVCGCGCGQINILEEDYLYSNAEGKYYVDKLCLVADMAEAHQGDRIKWMDHWISEQEFIYEVMEVQRHES